MPHLTPKKKEFKADAPTIGSEVGSPTQWRRGDLEPVIFDWSGVISDDRRPVYEANKIVVEKHGVKHENFQNWLIHTNASAPLYFASRGITADPDVLMEEYRQALHLVRTNGTHPVLYPDVSHTLASLSPRKQFVVSM